VQAGEAARAAEHSAAALARLAQAHDLVARDGGSRQGRLAYHLAALMAREHLIADDAAAARRLLDSVAGAPAARAEHLISKVAVCARMPLPRCGDCGGL
jgi:enoyl reductase-like protein